MIFINYLSYKKSYDIMHLNKYGVCFFIVRTP